MEVRLVTPTTSFEPLPRLRARLVSLLNNSGALLEIRRAGTDTAEHELHLKDGQSVALVCEASAAEWEVKGGPDPISLTLE